MTWRCRGRYSLESGLTSGRVGRVFGVPDGYVTQLGWADLAERRDWIAALPDAATRAARRWNLTPDGAPLHGYCAVVWPVRTSDGTAAVLKISWPHDEAEDEGVALRAWAGRGTVRLLDADGYALLLERLDSRHSLNEEPLDEAVTRIATLLRTLAIPAPPLHRGLSDVAARLAATLPARADGLAVPGRLVSEAVGYCRELGPTAQRLLVNEDLHYFNVLRGERQPWLVIDPKPLLGEPEYCVIPMLWNRYEETGGAQGVRARFDAIVGIAGLDPERARAWTVVRAVSNWVWTLNGGGVPFANVLAGISGAMTEP